MFLNYFHSLKNSIFALLLIGACLNGMEETEPLLNPQDTIINAEDLEQMHVDPQGDLDEPSSGFYTGERKFYDEAAYKKAKYNACKRCALFTALRALAGAGVGAAEALLGEGIVFALRIAILGDSDASYWTLKTLTPYLVPGAAVLMASFATIAWGVKKAKEERAVLDSVSLTSNEKVSLDQITFSLDDTRLECHDTQRYKEVLQLPKNRFKILNFISPTYRKIRQLKQTIESRESLRFEYALTGLKLKKIMTERLGKNVTQKLFSCFKKKNILVHLFNEWSDDVFFATEKELMSLLFLNSNNHGYRCAESLAKCGWCSFEQSEKYPIRVNWGYFDKNALSNDNRTDCFFIQDSPYKDLYPRGVFFPYCKELVRYYKFEEDPAYRTEYEKPSNQKIKRLLELRESFLSQGH